jgi:hypothetical protein
LPVINWGSQAWFKINIGTRKISDISRIRVDTDFTAVGGSSGTGVYARSAPPTGYLGGGNGGSGAFGAVGRTNYDYPLTQLASSAALTGEVYLVFTAHANTGSSYTIKNIRVEFPAAGSHVPVTDISNVPTVVVVNTEVDLSEKTVLPANATGQVIVWSVTGAGAGVTAGPLATGKFTPTSTGTVTVTATVADGGAAAGASFTKAFPIDVTLAVPAITIKVGGTDQSVNLLSSAGAATLIPVVGTTGFKANSVGYGNSFVYFKVDLDTNLLADLKEVKATYTPTSGDTNDKSFFLAVQKNAFGAYNGFESGTATIGKSGNLTSVLPGGAGSAQDAVISTSAKWTPWSEDNSALEIDAAVRLTAAAAALTGETELHFSISIHAGTAAYQISDIEFVFE